MMPIIIFVVVAAWWNPWSLSDNYIDHVKSKIEQQEQSE